MRLMSFLERGLLGLGAALLLFYAAAQTHAAFGRQQALDAFRVAQAQRASPVQAGKEPLPTGNNLGHPDQSLWSDSRKDAYRQSLQEAGGAADGVLKIPAIDLRVPIFDGTGEINLNRGVGRIEGTAALASPGNVGIAGHRDGYFRGLKDLNIGDVIEVDTLGSSVSYRIAEFMIVEPTDVDVLRATEHHTLTLVTCYPFYFVGHAPQRFIVRGVLHDSWETSQTSEKIAKE